jgi:uncharacterized protein (TIGR02996 family)
VSEEDALLRGMIDRPGDDTARLVYADWLDERDDPRGPYLRAEHAGTRGFQTLAAGLDPLWVARVSRPPFGVCCDHVRFDCMGVNSGPPLVAEDLDAFEKKVRVKLPLAYRAFVLNRNGGYPYPERVAVPGTEQDDWRMIESFYMIGPRGWREDHNAKQPSPIRAVHDDPFGELGRLLPLADYGGTSEWYLGVDGAHAGAVFYHSDPVHAWGDYQFDRVADSLPQLLSWFAHTDPDWVQALIRNEPEALVRWLDAGGDPNAEHDENEWHPIEYAVQWDRPELVKLLLARGATVTENAWDIATHMPNVRDLIRTACPKKPKRGRK